MSLTSGYVFCLVSYLSLDMSQTSKQLTTAPCQKQNIVSSLPFLAPVFLRKARQYTSKYGSSGGSNKYASGGGHSTGSRLGNMVSNKLSSSKSNTLASISGDAYKLSSVSSSPRRGTYATAAPPTGSEENILKSSPENSIMKSVTYSVRVD